MKKVNVKATPDLRSVGWWVLHPGSRWAVLGAWGALFFLLFAVIAVPVLFGGARRPSNDVGASASIPNLKTMVPLSTPIEQEWVQKLSLVRQPLPANAPPAQTAPARASNLVFGVSDGAAFNTATRILNALRPACNGLGTVDKAQLDVARSRVGDLVAASNSNRGLLHYHQGLIELCDRNFPAAEAEFKAAHDAISDYKKRYPAAATQNQLIVGQYEALTGYGRGLAMIGEYQQTQHPGVSEIDKVLLQAKIAAQTGAAADQPGPFTTFSYSGSSRRAVRDLFDFSTADIDTARLYLGLISGKPELGLEDRDPMPADRRVSLASAGSYAMSDPTLAANLSAAAAAAGNTTVVDDLFRRFSAGMNSRNLPSAWFDAAQAQTRMAEFAVTGSQDLVSDSNAAWWPRPVGGPSRVRLTFRQGGSAGSGAFDVPFPPVAEPGDDAEILDMWLWVRRERLQLQTGQFGAFDSDGDVIRDLNPQTKDFLMKWRRQATTSLGGQLLAHANMVRKRDGFGAASDLYRMLARSGFPFRIQSRARLALAYHSPAWVILVALGLAALVLGWIAWMHREVRIGHRRLFFRRHYLDRMAKAG